MSRKKTKPLKKTSRSKPGRAPWADSKKRGDRGKSKDEAIDMKKGKGRRAPIEKFSSEKTEKGERQIFSKSRRHTARETSQFTLPEDVFYLTGRHTCEAVLRYQPKRVRHLYILDGGKGLDLHLKLAQGIRCRISFVSRMDLDQRAPDLQHQGVILEVEAYPTVAMEDLPRSEMPLWVGLDGVQDPRNLGAAARACYAFGADGLCIPKNRAAQVTPITEKIAVGALS